MWEVGSGTRKSTVWWGAIISNVARNNVAAGLRSVNIRYDAMHGHKSTSATVRFVSASVLEALEGGNRYRRHFWRWVRGGKRGLRGRRSEAPSLLTVHETDSCENADMVADAVHASAKDEVAIQVDLKIRVEAIEAQLHSIVSGKNSREFESDRPSARPLSFARNRLGAELSKPLPGSSAALKKYTDAHAVAPDCLVVQVDCTLLEFKDLCEVATSMVGGGLNINPRHPRSNSIRVLPTNMICFQRFYDMCKVLGVSCAEEVADSLVKTKFGKRENAPVSVRVLGCLSQNKKHPNGPLVLAVGARIGGGLGPEDPVHVLFRRSRVWDQVEGSFADKLTTKAMSLSEFNALEITEDSDTASSAHTLPTDEYLEFTLHWVRTSALTKRFFEEEESSRVLSFLKIAVPFVMFRGLAL
jgi:hypothetical protein